MSFRPGYLELSEDDLKHRVELAYKIMENCDLCPRNCKVNRLNRQRGTCSAQADLVVASASPHFGEEPPLVGFNGSGTIFFTYCNLHCVFCQNYDISHHGRGTVRTVDQLAKTMINLQHMGCHNINLVTPTHFVPGIIHALEKAIELGLNIPIVYNCGGYENIKTLELLHGLIDIYMPDIKFLDPDLATLYMSAPDYPQKVQEALVCMYKQVGDLEIDENGIATRGLLVRHLVMPNAEVNTEKILEFIARELSVTTYINIMDQYYPMYRSFEFDNLKRRVTSEEYIKTCNRAQSLGLHRGFGERL